MDQTKIKEEFVNSANSASGVDVQSEEHTAMASDCEVAAKEEDAEKTNKRTRGVRTRGSRKSSTQHDNELSQSDREYSPADASAHYSEDDEYVASENDELDSLDDYIYIPPGVGGDDARSAAVAQQMRELFSSDDDEMSDEHSDALYQDILDANDELRPNTKRSAKGSIKPLKMKDEARVYYELAQKEYENGAMEDAILMIEEAIKLDANTKLPYMLLDAIYSDIGDVEKSLKAKVAAALLDKNQDDWIDVARISVELGHLDQATLFYRRAIELDELDHQIMYELVELYIEMNKLGPACELMKKVHQLFPIVPEYTTQLARLYMLQGMLQDAVNIFENLLEQNKEAAFLDPEEIQPFGWSELNSLAELYNKQKAWHKTIKSVKSISRWLCGRGSETWWDDMKDDSEFDERRFDRLKTKTKNQVNAGEGKVENRDNEEQDGTEDQVNPDADKYTIPLDIRIKLLQARLQLGDIEEARHHTNELLRNDPEVFLDLFWVVGLEYMELGYYATGLELFNPILDVEEGHPSELLLAIGKCEMGLGNWSKAEEQFQTVLDADDQNIEALVGLAETYYAMGHDEDALALIETVQSIRRERELDEKKISEAAESNSESADEPTSFYKKPRRRRPDIPRIPTKLEKQQAEQKAIATVESSFRMLQRYWNQLAQNINNMVAVTEWTQIANTLVNMFLSVKRFYHRHGTRLTIFQKGEDADIDSRLAKLTLSVQQSMDEEKQEGEEKNAVITVFRGLPIDTWFDIFMQVSANTQREKNLPKSEVVLTE